MGSVNDVRNALLETWDHAVQRTGMVVMSADSVDTLAFTITGAMAAADDRPDVVDLLEDWRRADFGPLFAGSMAGWFDQPGVGRRAGAAEAVAWHCQPFAAAGWVNADRLNADAWDDLQLAEARRFTDDGWTRERLEVELPPPSLVVDRRIYCYAPTDPLDQWVYFELVVPTGPPWRGPADPLRSVRIPGDGPAYRRVVLTPDGRRLATDHLTAAMQPSSA